MNKYQTMLKKMKSNVTIVGHTHSTRLRELVLAGVMKCVGVDSNYFGDPLPFADIKSTSTYDKCLHVVLNAETEIVNVEVYEGDSMDGEIIWNGKRAVYSLDGDWRKYNRLAEAVESKFNDYIDELLRKEDELAMSIRHQQLKRVVLEGL